MDLIIERNGYPLLHQPNEEGMVDLVFRIVDLTRGEKWYEFQLLASYEDELVGFAVRAQSDMNHGLDKNMNLIPDHVYREGVQFIRSGRESDQLVKSLANLYAVSPQPKTMVNNELFTAIILSQKPVELEREEVRIKLFANDGEDANEDDYYESFLNLDLPNELALWAEKDWDYRLPLIRGLSSS